TAAKPATWCGPSVASPIGRNPPPRSAALVRWRAFAPDGSWISGKICHTETVVSSRALGLLFICALAADPAVRKPAPAKPAPLKTSPTVRRWMRPMTARDEVAQLIFIAFHGEAPHTRSREYRRFL